MIQGGKSFFTHLRRKLKIRGANLCQCFLKNHLKIVPGDPFWSPQCYRINVREIKKPKICETMFFSEPAVFSTFFRVQKSYTVNSARRRRRGVEKLTIPRSNGWHVQSRVVLLGKPSVCLPNVRLCRQTNDLWPLAPAK